jgi:hypothetical protein
MTRWRALMLTALVAACLAGCQVPGPANVVRGSGNVRTESRTVQGFDRVEVDGQGVLTITQGAAESLRVQAEDNLLAVLRSEVAGGRLRLGPAPGTSIAPTRPIRYDLTVTRLSAIDSTGAAEVTTSGLSADRLALTVTGSGSADLGRSTVGGLTVGITGSGGVRMAGEATSQTVTVTGSGSYAASGLSSRRAAVESTGSGDCALRVSDHLSVTVSGSGRVTYVGSPAVDRRVTGSGTVTRAG